MQQSLSSPHPLQPTLTQPRVTQSHLAEAWRVFLVAANDLAAGAPGAHERYEAANRELQATRASYRNGGE